jgi:hypothetical protein
LLEGIVRFCKPTISLFLLRFLINKQTFKIHYLPAGEEANTAKRMIMEKISQIGVIREYKTA